jgi:hypothetical protein
MTSPSEYEYDRKGEHLLLQDCNRKLFNWFLSRIDWKRILKELATTTT